MQDSFGNITNNLEIYVINLHLDSNFIHNLLINKLTSYSNFMNLL